MNHTQCNCSGHAAGIGIYKNKHIFCNIYQYESEIESRKVEIANKRDVNTEITVLQNSWPEKKVEDSRYRIYLCGDRFDQTIAFPL